MNYQLSKIQQQDLARVQRVRLKCTGDGHCLLYAVYGSLKTEVLIGEVRFDQFVVELYAGLLSFLPTIMTHYPDGAFTEEELTDQVHLFMFHRSYNQDAVDAVLDLVSMFYKCNIVVFQQGGQITIGPGGTEGANLVNLRRLLAA